MRMKWIGGLMMVLAVVASGQIVQAETIYVTVKGKVQGQFKGDASPLQKGFEGKITCHRFRYELLSPRDPASGQATGRRQHNPVMLTKEWGPSSPQFFQALTTNEILSEVVIDFVGVDPRGLPTLTHRITLANATLSGITHSTDTSDKGVRHLEDVSFTFQRIELEDVSGKTRSADTWNMLQ